MSIDIFEIWVHDNILKNAAVRHFLYGTYQRLLYIVSPKVPFQGDVQALTPNDNYEYLFGYYDKSPWDESGRYLLALRVASATDVADSTEKADIVRIDLSADNHVDVIASTYCWNTQQGCMMQWIDAHSILYNDFREGKYCSIILDVDAGREKQLGMPVYTVSADKKTALTLDFSRLHRLRPGYGYANLPEDTANEKCPDKTCIWKIDLESGIITPLLRYTDFAQFEPRPEMKDAEHKVNHLMLSPDGTRFMVLHRWFCNNEKYTRLVTCNTDGTGMFNLSDDDFVSHCCWKNNEEILSYLNKKESGKGYYILKDRSDDYSRMWPELAVDGHPTYSPNGKYVVTDTYPNRRRIQSLYVMGKIKVKCVAKVFAPFKFRGDVRCDLHPRWNGDGTQICFDAAFSGKRGISLVKLSRKEIHVDSLKTRCAQEYPVSVIIPCYNAESFIGETLASLEAQTFKDFEVVVINDGSKDGTLQLLQEWQKNSMLHLSIIDRPNGGVSCARNKGIIEAKGEYLLFLDADDIYHEEMIERMLDAVQKTGADTSYCRGSRNLSKVREYYAQKETYIVHSQSDAMNKQLFEMGSYGFYSYLYRKELLLAEHIQFDENTKFGEDREFVWKYLCHCNRLAWIDMPLYGYRMNENSATHAAVSWRKTDLLTAIKRIESYLDENNCGFSATFNSYMFARAMWAVAKTFAVNDNKELFNRLRSEYDVRNCMKKTAKDANKLVALSSAVYCIAPVAFYHLVQLRK